jgi:hypothetical protein
MMTILPSDGMVRRTKVFVSKIVGRCEGGAFLLAFSPQRNRGTEKGKSLNTKGTKVGTKELGSELPAASPLF